MEVGKLNAQFRGDIGKSAVRRLRAAGKIPAICYGQAQAPLPLSVDPIELVKSLDPVKKTNTVLTLNVAGAPDGDAALTVMVRDYQKDAIRGHLTHADFIRVDLTKPVHATVPIVLTGKAEGVKLGEGIRPLTDGGQTVCAVTAPKAEKEVAPTAAEGAVPAEGAAAAPAEGAAAAAPAAGGKGGAAPAAAGGAAPAAGGEKKGGKK